VQLAEEAQALLRQCEAMTRRLQAGAAGPAGLKIGLTTVVDTERFAQLLPALLEGGGAAGAPIELRRQSSVKSVRDVERGRLDAAIIGLPALTHGLTVRRLYRDPFCVALARDHRLAQRQLLSLRELEGEVLFWFRRELNPGFHDHCEKLFKRLAFAPQRAPEPADHHVLLSMIANHGGIGLIPASLRTIEHRGVVFRELKEGDQLCVDIGIAYQTPDEALGARLELVRLVEGLVGYFDKQDAVGGKANAA
jgi:DNA-binding transcriptional LysR family regulator